MVGRRWVMDAGRCGVGGEWRGSNFVNIYLGGAALGGGLWLAGGVVGDRRWAVNDWQRVGSYITGIFLTYMCEAAMSGGWLLACCGW